MEQKEKVQELAETLKSRGLAASMIDALDKAKNIIYGIATKKEEPKVEKQNQKEENIEIQNTGIDESKVIEKDNSENIKEIYTDTSSVEVKNDQDQKKLDEVKIEVNDYDISKEERTVNEVLNEKEEDVFVSSHESDDLLKEDNFNPQTEQIPETITTIEESNSEEAPINVEDVPEKTEDKKQVEEEKEKSQLTEKEKKTTDLSEIFNFGKR